MHTLSDSFGLRRWWIAIVAIVATRVVNAQAQPPAAGTISLEQYEVRETRGHKAAMRDGVRISVDLYQPAAEGRFPAILVHTPYSNNSAGLMQRARWFARRGYAVALSDSRGRFDSEGDWDPFDRRHKTDGYDLVEWLAAQPWCQGSVGMMGSSYSGWTQWWTASQAPPSLKAMVPEVSPPDQFQNAPYQQGILVSWAMDWAATMAGRTGQVISDGPYGGFFATRAADYLLTPYVDLNRRRGALDSPWFDTWLRENLSTADYWKGIAYQGDEHYSRVTVPSLNISGWYDANYPGSPRNYLGMKQHGATPAARRPTLVIGPWQHSFNRERKLGDTDYGPDAVIDWDGYACRWFDHFLKGIDNGVESDPPVYVFVMGPNRWYQEQDWPLPQTQWTTYYLHSGGNANSLTGDGGLNCEPPNDEPCDAYIYDPAKPTRSPFKGGHLEDGPIDTRESASGADVLVYSTPPLESDLEVTGPIEAALFAATSARDTDWMMRLVDVRPDGYSALLCDGVMRARCRDPREHGAFTSERLSEIEPGQVYEYTIRFWRATGNVFAKGHRIRVEISSSYYPYYLRNLNTGADNIAFETNAVEARQQMYHDAEHASRLVLPVIPRRE